MAKNWWTTENQNYFRRFFLGQKLNPSCQKLVDRLKFNYFRRFRLLGPLKVTGPLEIGIFPTPAPGQPTHSHACSHSAHMPAHPSCCHLASPARHRLASPTRRHLLRADAAYPADARPPPPSSARPPGSTATAGCLGLLTIISFHESVYKSIFVPLSH
jgi:hypothetical protein